MKKIRNIPFGYRFLQGTAIIDETEGPAVLNIYTLYKGGRSYQNIADEMTRRGIPYHPDKPVWNRNMVKRILQNERYLGTEIFPPLVSDHDFQTVSEIIRNKTSHQTAAPKVTQAIRQMVYCHDCGAPMQWKRMQKHNVWSCSNQECTCRITDVALTEQLLALMNQLIADPNQISIPKPEKWTDPLETVKTINLIQREMEKPDCDEKVVKELICACAAENYRVADDGSRKRFATIIRKGYEQGIQQNEINLTLLQESVEKIQIAGDGSLTVMLKSGQEIRAARKEYENV